MLPIVRPHFPSLESFSARFDAALKSGNVTNNGPAVQEFERALTEYLVVPTICFSSGQAALMTMLACLGVEGGEVICPSFTFAATPHAVTWAGARPAFADIDPNTLCLDVKDVACRINRNTRAILGVDAYGICCDYDALAELGRIHGLPVIYDSAAAFGSIYKGRLTGGFGNAQIFSFHATKPFATMEGGCLSSNDPVLIKNAMRVRNFGQEDDGDCKVAGINGKMMEVCAMIGREQLKTWRETANNRKNAALLLRHAVGEIAEIIPVDPNQDPIWLYQPVFIQDWPCTRDEVIDGLKQRGVTARKYYQPAHQMTAYKATKVELPVTERAGRDVIALPIYSDMTTAEINTIASALKSIKNGS